MVLEVTKEVLEVTKVVEEVTIFQRATEAATRCPAWGKPPTVTHCQHRAWRARTRTKVVFELLDQNFLSILKSLPGPQSSHPHNTLPARVGESPPRAAGGGGHPHQGAAGHNVHNGPHYPTHPANLQPTGRHFKPFDHRKMNPMAEIQVPV